MFYNWKTPGTCRLSRETIAQVRLLLPWGVWRKCTSFYSPLWERGFKDPAVPVVLERVGVCCISSCFHIPRRSGCQKRRFYWHGITYHGTCSLTLRNSHCCWAGRMCYFPISASPLFSNSCNSSWDGCSSAWCTVSCEIWGLFPSPRVRAGAGSALCRFLSSHNLWAGAPSRARELLLSQQDPPCTEGCFQKHKTQLDLD